ncbi:MAG: hypothetical protein PVH79_01005 [Candidatus Bathyarchaeota archaeon]|jgi:predicted nucleotidyltransferase
METTRELVAKEAARLLYYGISEEYKHAKERAARSLGFDALPSNHEVAIQLDMLAETLEGEKRKELLVIMRELAVNVMRILKRMNPILRGSVWRGTARLGSDIDIDVYSNRPGEAERLLSEAGYKIEGSEEAVSIQDGRTSRSTHIKINLDEGIDGEVVVRPTEEMSVVENCEIFGDLKRGLSLGDLEKLMKTDPLRKFVPKRRYK